PDVVDPLGGSYYVEALTAQMEERAWAIVEEVDTRGGMLQACEDGYVQDEIGRSAWEFQAAVERGERRIVGVTHYRDLNDAPAELTGQRVSPARVAGQMERVRLARESRDQTRAEAARARIRDLASNPGDNSFDAVVHAVRAGLTHGEVVTAMRDAFGFGRPRA